MSDFLLAGLIYVPMYLAGAALSQHFDPYLVGWFAGSWAVLLRWKVPGLRIQ